MNIKAGQSHAKTEEYTNDIGNNRIFFDDWRRNGNGMHSINEIFCFMNFMVNIGNWMLD